MSEAKRYWADMVPLTWDSEGVGKVQEVYLASDYDALREKAVRLRAIVKDCTGVVEGIEELLRETADLEVTP
jgi:hypothetical protein